MKGGLKPKAINTLQRINPEFAKHLLENRAFVLNILEKFDGFKLPCFAKISHINEGNHDYPHVIPKYAIKAKNRFIGSTPLLYLYNHEDTEYNLRSSPKNGLLLIAVDSCGFGLKEPTKIIDYDINHTLKDSFPKEVNKILDNEKLFLRKFLY